MRNLIKGKANSSSETQIGYKKKRTKYNEGDIWKENKKPWTIKNGIKQTISKLDKIKKEIFLPLCCPKCNKIMKSRFDEPNYRIHKKCHSCVVEFEHKLHIDKKYHKYIENLKLKNSLNIVDEMESYLLDAINTSNTDFVSENGVIEKWKGGVNKKEFTQEVKKAAKIRRDHINKKLNEQKK